MKLSKVISGPEDLIYIVDIEVITKMFAVKLGVSPKVWKCPCNEAVCQARVVYARGHDDRIYFMSTQTFQKRPPYPTIIIDHVEDFAMFLQSELLPPGDLYVYAYWLQHGLKEAIISA